MVSEPIAVIGATGTVGSRIVRDLVEQGIPVRAASRSGAGSGSASGSGSGSVRFDWDDETTFAPLVHGAAAVYLLPPVGSGDPAPPMRRLVQVALGAGVPRLVLHSATVVAPGDPGIGEIHALLATEAPEWAVVRPSWFMQNLQPGHGHYLGDQIGARRRIPTSLEDGRITFVDADDIAAVAVRALTDAHPLQDDVLVTGPEALSYDDVATILSDVSGRAVVHERVDTAQVEQIMVDAGIPPQFARYLAHLEDALRAGSESAVSDGVPRITGRPARSLRDWATAHADSWS